MDKRAKRRARIARAHHVVLALGAMLPVGAALAQVTDGAVKDAATSDAAGDAAKASSSAAARSTQQTDTIVINGIRRGQLILPTTVDSSSAYGLDLGVMDTPRSNTILSRTQLDALNVQDPQQFSYLTSSSYADASFGLPNIPRIRGQYGDVFFNGMRDSFSSNGYGAPLSFNSIDTMDIVKGPASVQAGPGAGVGGSINISTKVPNFNAFTATATVDIDTAGHRRQSLDFGGPASSNLAYRISYAGEESDSYYDYQYFHEQAIYGSVIANISDKYTIQVNSELALGRYTENDGINRVNQQLIDNGSYLTGGVIGGPANISGFGSMIQLGSPVQLSRRTNVDGAPGTGARSTRYNLQVIQTYDVNQNATLVNNTFFNYINRYNQTQMYFADTAQGTYTIENKTDLKLKFDTPFGDQSDGHGLNLKQQIDAGFTFRLSHTNEVQNFANEPVSIFDLSQNPTTLAFPASAQAGGGAVPYTAAFGLPIWGVSARDPYFPNSSIDSDLYDAAVFLEHRIEFSPKFSILYGLRADVVKLHESDPISDPTATLPASFSTNAYLLKNANFSPVYKPLPWISTYLTANFAQYVNPNSQDGGVGTYTQDASSILRQDTKLLEAGVKLDLMHKSLFAGADVFKQSRAVSTGPGGTTSSLAHILGFEAELNYQPNPNFFATASYSYISTKLDTPAAFYNFPAQPGVNMDGAGALAVFEPNQNFNDPGVPRQLFNFLINYKTDYGVGFQTNWEVISPIETSQSGQLDVAASLANGVPAQEIPAGGYFKAPVIPWQYTANASMYYDFDKKYQLRFSIYNLTNQRNIYNDIPFYGNDFITVGQPRSFGLQFKAKI
ncbi:MAG TPA: TonB-dependent receptor [Burkholderiaceae bacterium]|jgi:outer membrane receptor protein involved in Fe transport